MSLLLKKNGVLESIVWEYDDHIDHEGKFVHTPITNELEFISKLVESCEFEDNVTLNSLFLLVDRFKTPLSLLMPNCFINEYVSVLNEQLTQEELDKTKDIDYLELSTDLEPVMDGYLCGLFLPQFGSQGKVLTEDDLEMGYKVGDRIPWSLSFQKTSALLHLPVIIRNSINIEDVDGNIQTLKLKPQYTLFQIIYGIFYELSWYGSPEDSMKQKNELDAIVSNINCEDFV